MTHRTRGEDAKTKAKHAPAQGAHRARGRESIGPPAAHEPDRALVAGIVALALLPLAAAAIPGTWAWGVNGLRTAPAAMAWACGAALALALLPPVAQAIAAALEKFSPFAMRNVALTAVLWGALLALLVWALPDRTFYTGDFLIRLGTAQQVPAGEELFPQAMPFDLALHAKWPRALAAAGAMNSVTFERLWGALKALLYGYCAFRVARSSGRRGAVVLAATVIASGGVVLAMFSGYPKALSELALFAAVFIASALSELESNRGFFIAAVAMTESMLTHRSAVLLLPAFATLAGVRLGRARSRGEKPSRLDLTGIALVIAALGWTAPRIVRSWFAVDAEHLLPGHASPLAALGAALSPLHLLDALNVVLAYAPLAPILLLLPSVWKRVHAPRGAGAVVLALAVPALVMIVLVHPRQGPFRDFDVYAVAGVALSMLSAWAIARMLPERASAWPAVTAAVVALASGVLVLATFASTPHGLARAQSFVASPPERPGNERGLTWRYLGLIAHRLGDHREALAAYERAAHDVPSPSVLELTASEAIEVGDLRVAQMAYRAMMLRSAAPELALELARVSLALGDWAAADSAARQVLAETPGQREAQGMLDEAERQSQDARLRAGVRNSSR